MKRLSRLCTALCLSGLAIAGQSADEVNHLGVDLTPTGAEKAAKGDIPAWQGMEPTPAGWAPGKRRIEFSPLKDERPSFSIDASNVDKHADKLSPGQIQLIKQVKGYRMDVYPTKRTCSVPDYVASNTRKNVGLAKISADGWSLQNAQLPGVPFPFPQTGIEAIWNFLVRYQGVGMEWPSYLSYVSPRPGSNDAIVTHGPASYFFPWGRKDGATPDSVNQFYLGFNFAFDDPAALAGQAVTQRYYFEKPNETFYYFPGQRRVRRMPTYSYDSPLIGYENQYLVDETFMFYGTPDRFDWKLVGKKEMYVPANSFRIYDGGAKLEDVVQPQAINSAYRRYELRRVWVVESTVKQGARHVTPKRTFYLDEDSWLAVVSDAYDSQGKLWKTREGHQIPAWEIGACVMTVLTQYDLLSGRYVFDGSAVGTGKEVRWFGDSKDAIFTNDYYRADSLQSRSER